MDDQVIGDHDWVELLLEAFRYEGEDAGLNDAEEKIVELVRNAWLGTGEADRAGANASYVGILGGALDARRDFQGLTEKAELIFVSFMDDAMRI